MSLTQLITISHAIGAESPLWTQGTSGNVSLKGTGPNQESLLWIKAAKIRLSEVTNNAGHTCVSLKSFQDSVDKIAEDSDSAEMDYLAAIRSASMSGDLTRGASREVGIHAVLGEPLVLHFHALSAILMYHKCTTGGRAPVEGALATQFKSWTFINNILPGYRLMRRIEKHKECEVFVLANHGVLMQTSNANVLEQWRRVETDFFKRFSLSWPDAKRILELTQSPAPMKLYLPDAAALQPDLLRVLVAHPADPTGQVLYTLPMGCWNTDRALAELWAATVVLYEMAPDLPEMDPVISDALLPKAAS